MTYIYAYSNHKTGLSRLRRMAVTYKALEAEGTAVEMLTNDFRAAAAIRDYGVPACTTIETVLDIDCVAERGDSLIMDTPEDDLGKLEIYAEMFRSVKRVAQYCEDVSRYGETVLFVDPLVDSFYHDAKKRPKEERTLLFFGDADPEKWLLTHGEAYADLQPELLLGEYFFVGYEERLETLFPVYHEAESYRELIAGSSSVFTCDLQAAYEARTAGADVYFCAEAAGCERETMQGLGIHIVERVR